MTTPVTIAEVAATVRAYRDTQPRVVVPAGVNPEDIRRALQELGVDAVVSTSRYVQEGVMYVIPHPDLIAPGPVIYERPAGAL